MSKATVRNKNTGNVSEGLPARKVKEKVCGTKKMFVRNFSIPLVKKKILPPVTEIQSDISTEESSDISDFKTKCLQGDGDVDLSVPALNSALAFSNQLYSMKHHHQPEVISFEPNVNFSPEDVLYQDLINLKLDSDVHPKEFKAAALRNVMKKDEEPDFRKYAVSPSMQEFNFFHRPTVKLPVMTTHFNGYSLYQRMKSWKID